MLDAVLSLDALRADPLRPVGLAEVASITDPWITRASWQQWARRGLLPDPAWIVNGSPAWHAYQLVRVLDDETPLHFADGRAHRCGSTCPFCAVETPSTWSDYWTRVDA